MLRLLTRFHGPKLPKPHSWCPIRTEAFEANFLIGEVANPRPVRIDIPTPGLRSRVWGLGFRVTSQTYESSKGVVEPTLQQAPKP